MSEVFSWPCCEFPLRGLLNDPHAGLSLFASHHHSDCNVGFISLSASVSSWCALSKLLEDTAASTSARLLRSGGDNTASANNARGLATESSGGPTAAAAADCLDPSYK